MGKSWSNVLCGRHDGCTVYKGFHAREKISVELLPPKPKELDIICRIGTPVFNSVTGRKFSSFIRWEKRRLG